MGLRIPVTNDELEEIAFCTGAVISMGGKRPTCTVDGITYVGGER